MTRLPVIYLSAPTPDLERDRSMARSVLEKRGCEVRALELAPLPPGEIPRQVEKLLRGCDLAVQIIGCHETPLVPNYHDPAEMIYIHALEMERAKVHEILVHPIFLTEDYPADPTGSPASEPELSERHRYWRTFMRSDLLLYIPQSPAELSSHLRSLYLGPFYSSGGLGKNLDRTPLEAPG